MTRRWMRKRMKRRRRSNMSMARLDWEEKGIRGEAEGGFRGGGLEGQR